MAGIKQEEEKPKNLTLDDLRKQKSKVDELREKYEIAKKRNVPLNLVDNFNWVIAGERRKRKIDRRQLAEAIGESELAVKMIENKEFPDDALKIISKIEQYLGIKLRKDNNRNEQDRIREAIAGHLMKPAQISQQAPSQSQLKPSTILKFNPETTKNITIADLQRMKLAREREEKEVEKVEDVVWRKNEEVKVEEKAEEDKGLIGEEIEFEEEEVGS